MTNRMKRMLFGLLLVAAGAGFCADDAAAIATLIEKACRAKGGRTVTLGRNPSSADGVWTISRPIVLPSDFTLQLDGAHLVLGTGTFCNMFRADGATNVTLVGRNGAVVDGGVYNGLHEKNAGCEGRPPMTVNNLLLFTDVKGFRIESIRFVNQRWWALDFIACSHGVIRKIDFLSHHTSVAADGRRGETVSRREYGNILVKNSDGIDLRAGCHDILIEDITGFTEDDTVALTCLKGGFERDFLRPGDSYEIRDIKVRNVRAASMCSLVRLLAQGGGQIHRIVIENVEDASQEGLYMTGRGETGVNIGDAHLYRAPQCRPEEMDEIVVRKVRSRAEYGVRIRGGAGRIDVSDVDGFDGCPHPFADDRQRVQVLSAGADAVGNVGETKLKGYLGTRLDRMIERHVIGTDVDYLTACFREKTETKGCWQTEFWGKYMHSAVPYLAYCGSETLRTNIDRSIERLLASQEPCGYIGNYPDELRCGEGWDVWGMKYTMMGLIHFYDGTRLRSKVEIDKGDAALAACRKLCDYVIAEIGPGGKRGRELWQTGNWSGYASSSILEPVVWLYRRTGEKRYLDFATYIVDGMTRPEKGPRLLDLALKGVSVADRNESDYDKNAKWSYVCKHGRSKAYEMMSCYQGILDYVEEAEKVEVEGRGRQWIPDLRRAAILTAEDIVKEEINLAGGCACSEAWFHGAKKQHLPYMRLQETCVTTTWMRFCEKLLEATDDPKWADQIERTFYNAYLGAMKADGSEFAGYTPLSGNRYHGQHHCFMHTDCCTANGPRGFLCFLRKMFVSDGKTATFNFYGSALVKGFDMYSLYPRQNAARIVSHATGPLAVRLRIPAWSEKTVVTLNGAVLPGVKPGSYFVLDRTWALGDIVEVTFDMPVVAHACGHHVAFTRGPVLLARDSRFADGDLTEPLRGSVGNGQKMPTFSPVRSPSDDIWMAFTATLPIGSHHENPEGALPETVSFCDYASAGNTWRRDNFYRTWFPLEYGPAE